MPLPVAGVALVLGVDRLLDMMRITGDAVGRRLRPGGAGRLMRCRDRDIAGNLRCFREPVENKVPREGLEPSRPYGHRILSSGRVVFGEQVS